MENLCDGQVEGGSAGTAGSFCRFVTAAELVVLLTLYVQGNFLVDHMPPFDGTEIVWEDYRGENIKTAIVCILIAAAVVTVAKLLGAKRFQRICMAVSAGLSGILMITLVTMTVTTGAYRERTTYICETDGRSGGRCDFPISGGRKERTPVHFL